MNPITASSADTLVTFVRSVRFNFCCEIHPYLFVPLSQLLAINPISGQWILMCTSGLYFLLGLMVPSLSMVMLKGLQFFDGSKLIEKTAENRVVKLIKYWGQHSTKVSILTSRPSCPRFCAKHYDIFSEKKIVNVAEVNQLRWLEESGQWIENVNQTHLVLDTRQLQACIRSHLIFYQVGGC